MLVEMESTDGGSGSGPQESYVVAGAILSCTFGTKRVRLTMPVSHGVYIKDKAQMNIKDYLPYVNVLPFGTCNSRVNPAVVKELEKAAEDNPNIMKEQEEMLQKANLTFEDGAPVGAPCTPVITMPWINGKEDTLVEGEPALLNICTLTCQHCGTIQIDDDGQE